MGERRCGWILALLQGLLLAIVAVVLVLQGTTLSSSSPSTGQQQERSGETMGGPVEPLPKTFASPLAHPVCGFVLEAPPVQVYRQVTRTRSQKNNHRLDFSVPVSDLKRGIRTRPRISYWHKILNQIQTSMEEKLPLNVVLLVPSSAAASRPQLLQERVEAQVNEWTSAVSSDWKISIRIQILDSDTTIGPSDMKNVDVLVDATGAAMNNNVILPNIPLDPETSSWKSSMTPDLANQLRASKQAWIRPFLLQQKAPVLLLVEAGWVGMDDDRGGGAWSALETTQSLQELADWYQIPFLSVPSILVPMKYTRHSQYKSLVNAYSENNANDTTMGAAAAPFALKVDLLMHVLFLALLDFTIDVCSAGPIRTEKLPIVSPNAAHLAEHVVPPSLDLSLSLSQISKLWKDEASKQAKA